MKLYSPVPLNPDDHVYFHVVVKPITGLLNEAGFDSETYYFSQRVVAKAYVIKNSEYTVMSQPSFRTRLYQHVKQLLHDHSYQGLLLALSFADRTGLTDKQWYQLKTSGLAHLVAISGLHIGIAYAFGFYLGGTISRIHPLLLWLPVVLGSACAWFYAWLAGFLCRHKEHYAWCSSMFFTSHLCSGGNQLEIFDHAGLPAYSKSIQWHFN
ncbi:ComEC/Rec2 family competence protein [Vibrio sp. PP-XX7]